MCGCEFIRSNAAQNCSVRHFAFVPPNQIGLTRPFMNSVLVVGSVALDSIETPAGTVDNALGGAATYGAAAASIFAPVQLVGVVGDDFPAQHTQFLENRGIDLAGLQRIEGGKTFRWKGDYNEDLNTAVTHETQLGVFETFEPTLPENYKKAELVFLANINPGLQLQVLDQVENPKLVLCDTMNLWINLARDTVLEVFKRVDIAVLNDGEARMLTEEDNLLKAARQLLGLGPRAIIIKKGEHGSMMLTRDALFSVPAYPLDAVVDPTGAGDTFAGSIMGYLAKTGDLSDANLRRAIVYGGAVASCTVQQFSLGGVRDLGMEEVERRFAAVRDLCAF